MLDDPTRSPEVVLGLKHIYRQKGRAQKHAYPLTRDLLDQLLSICGDDLKGQRDRVMPLLGYETMRRRSERGNFRFEDIEYCPAAEPLCGCDLPKLMNTVRVNYCRSPEPECRPFRTRGPWLDWSVDLYYVGSLNTVESDFTLIHPTTDCD